MRKLLNTLFVLSEGSYLSLDGENVLISKEKKQIARFPLHTLEGIISFSYILRNWIRQWKKQKMLF